MKIMLTKYKKYKAQPLSLKEKIVNNTVNQKYYHISIVSNKSGQFKFTSPSVS